jgi:signal transduction histidine kinase
MNRLSTKYIYLLVVLSIIISVMLQIAWLSQLFREEKRRTIDDIENMATAVSKKNLYTSLDEKFTGNSALNRFFLSPEWVDIWRGFDNVKDARLYKSFDVNPQKDSTTLEFRLVFLQHRPAHRSSPKYGMGYSARQMDKLDSLSLLSFKRSIAVELSKLELNKGYFLLVHSYVGVDHNVPAELKTADFVSKRYAYNFLHLHTVQLVVDSVTNLVWFKMRYYLISSILMIALTGIAFYFILKLMISRRLYADARVAFTSNMTHEIKTPIATVALALESISKYNLINDPVKLERYLNMGKQELQRLSHLVEKVLNLSQDDGEIKLSPVFYDVQTGLSDVIRSMELPLQNAGASCELVISPEPCFIEGDAVHLTTVFFNLIENAIKYTISPLKLLITCTCDAEWITISFKDNGPGIPEAFQDKIFERFFRVPQPGNTHAVKGSGLGLNYVYGVIQSHKGTITLESEEGKGSTFIVKLPAPGNEF